jgi:hypothetical protein
MTVDAAPRQEQLIRTLTAELTPVRRLRPPVLRAAAWLLCVVLVAGILLPVADLQAMSARLGAAPDMWLAALGSTATMVLAAIAVFELSVPDRSPLWAFLPWPAAMLWLGASGAGCLRVWLVPGTHAPALSEAKDCLAFIIGLSIPLSVLLLVMLRRACPLQPSTVHVLSVTMVIAANNALGGRLLQGPSA